MQFPDLKGLTLALTHCGLATPYGTKDLGQHWLRLWLVAWQHQAITWTNADLSPRVPQLAISPDPNSIGNIQGITHQIAFAD